MRQKFNYETITIMKTNNGEVFSPGDKVKMDYYVTGRLKIVTGIIEWINKGGNSGPAQIHLKDNPDINIDVNVNAHHMHDNFFNVSLLFKINGIVAEQPFFILEMEYAGVVSLNIPEEHVEPVLLVEIPRLFFPFARNIITNTLQNAGLPPLMLNPIDFAAMYQHKKQAN